MTSHNGNMQATCSLIIFCVLYANLFEQFYYFKVAMVGCIVQAIEALWIFVIDRVSQRALGHNLNNVFTTATWKSTVNKLSNYDCTFVLKLQYSCLEVCFIGFNLIFVFKLSFWIATYDPMAQASMTGVILNVENLKSKLDKLSVSIMSISIKYYASLCYIAISSCFYRAKIDRQEFISIDQSYFLLTWRVVNWWLTSSRVIRSKWLMFAELVVELFVRWEVVVLTPPTRLEL